MAAERPGHGQGDEQGHPSRKEGNRPTSRRQPPRRLQSHRDCHEDTACCRAVEKEEESTWPLDTMFP